MIFILFWSASDKSYDESYLNMVYKVTLSSQIKTNMVYDSKVIDLKNGKDLEISASCSSFIGSEIQDCSPDLTPSKGLSFQWDCGKTGTY